MKKIISVIAGLAIALAIVSCDTPQFGVKYTVIADGDANGKVALTFPDGVFKADGTAAIDFKWSNDTSVVFRTNLFTPVDEVRNIYTDRKSLKAVDYVEQWIDDTFKATAAEGDYYIHLKFEVQETATGIKISGERTFSNR